MNPHRGELNIGLGRQRPVEDPSPHTYPMSQFVSDDGLTWGDVIALEQLTMVRRFTVIESFVSDEMKTEYVAGQSYEAADGSGLSELVDEWIEQGKVREGGPEDAPPEESKE